jgi:tetratricopeptide (TPR) repeat protein
MSPRLRTTGVVAALALLAAVVVAGSAALSSDDRGAAVPTAAPTPREGAPPLVLELGVRDDAEARSLRAATRLYAEGKRRAARERFLRHDSLEAKVGAALAARPASLDRLEQLGALYPRSAFVQLHVGLARYWAGEPGALDAWREARDVEPDTPYAVSAGDLLHRDFAPGLPVFQPTRPLPAPVRGRRPAEQLELLRAGAEAGRLDYQLLYGVALQRLGRPVSARRAYTEAARAHPGEPEALVADAVGRYSKESPVEAFSRLGPLSRRFPRAATVRFHLGLLLLWQGDVGEARRQLRLAQAAEPGSRVAVEAGRYLDELAKVGTG